MIIIGLLILFIIVWAIRGFKLSLKSLIGTIIIVFLVSFIFSSCMSLTIFSGVRAEEKEVKAFLVKISSDTSWVNNSTQVYFSRGIHNEYNKFVVPFYYFDTKGELYIINSNGTGLRKIFETKGLINKVKFSPNNKYLTVQAGYGERFYLVDYSDGKVEFKDFKDDIPGDWVSGMDNIRILGWSKDSRMFVYRFIRRGSDGSHKVSAYLYNCNSKEKIDISSRLNDGFHFVWDATGDYFYYNKGLKIFRMPVSTLQPEEIGEMPDDGGMSNFNSTLTLLGIKYFDYCRYPGQDDDTWVSIDGRRLFVDKDTSYLYFQDNQGKLKNFGIKIPRMRVKRADSMMGHVSWLPGERYVLFSVRDIIVILDTLTGKIGKLAQGSHPSYIGSEFIM